MRTPFVGLVLVATLTLFCAAAFPQPPASREQALTALQSPKAPIRAQAIVWIGRHGLGSDAAPLYERLRDEDATVRSYAEQALWLVWSRSGDVEVDRLLERGIGEMQSGRSVEAVSTFSEVIRRKPEFAEGWNKRATARYLAGDFRGSLSDCDQVLQRNPRHFGALSGAGLNHLALEAPREALAWLRRALEVNPNLARVEAEIRRLEALLRGRSADYSAPARWASVLKSSA